MVPSPAVNPYAKKSKKSTSVVTNGNPNQQDIPPSGSHTESGTRTNPSSSSRNSNNKSNVNQYSLPSLPTTITAASFSQAFADEGLLPSSPNNGNATNQQVATESSNDPDGVNLQPPPDGDDRQYHVLLQSHVLYVSTKQQGNDVLKYIRNVPMAVSKMVPDYIMSSTTCALFLSIKYHQLYPHYIHRRIGELRTDFRLRVLLVLVDVEDNASALAYLNTLAVTHNLTLILAWTEAEAARYLETYKALDGKDASSIQKRESTNFQEQTADFLTACKPVNKTDSANLLHHFSTIQAVVAASSDELALCEGLGPIKVKKLYEALHKPFSKFRARQRKRAREEMEQRTNLDGGPNESTECVEAVLGEEDSGNSHDVPKP